jgi:diguanylate cyclase (GGDEF)-like protein/PAS domain S-box-containing protein
LENNDLHLDAIERKEVMKVSEDRYHLLLDHSPAGIFHYDMNLIITYCNNRLSDILHHSVDSIVGWDLKVDTDQSILPSLSKVLAGQTSTYEGRYNVFSDNTRWIALTCAPSKDSRGNVVGGIAILEDITERKQFLDEIQDLAFYDQLTHLPNRRLLLDRLHQALASSTRNGRNGALLFLDLDHFKTLNDTLGHGAGDLLLQEVATRMANCVCEHDTVARFGGDEFVVMLEDLSESKLEAAAQAEVIGKKIMAMLSQPYRLDSYEYHCTSSVGVTLFCSHERSLEDLLKQADIAMYHAKKVGRNTLQFFDQPMQEAIHARVDLERELHIALQQHQFQLRYQIQVDYLNNPIGAEASLHWMHPKHGLYPPSCFIPMAEETGLILPIGQWVIEAACTQIKAWKLDALTRELSLSVNVSSSQFLQKEFVSQVKTAVQRHDINPMLLKLELTESLLLNHIEHTVAIMTSLQEFGIRFSLDDFGTGYSSLQYLKCLPLYQLKIDQSFVRDIATDLSDQAIVRTIIAMAKALNLNVIAEGVETEEQQYKLLSIGCMHYQGYLFGRPVPIKQFEAALKMGNWLTAYA